MLELSAMSSSVFVVYAAFKTSSPKPVGSGRRPVLSAVPRTSSGGLLEDFLFTIEALFFSGDSKTSVGTTTPLVDVERIESVPVGVLGVLGVPLDVPVGVTVGVPLGDSRDKGAGSALRSFFIFVNRGFLLLYRSIG